MKTMNYEVYKNNLKDPDLSKQQVISTINRYSYVTANKLDLILEKYISIETSRYCRNRYLDNFSLEQFEKNLLEVLR